MKKEDLDGSKLNPTNGHIIHGTLIDKHRFVGRLKAAQLFQIAPDPRDTEDKRRVDASKQLQHVQGIREQVQRNFDGAKRKNVPSYARYIVNLHNGDVGITPPITLYSETPLEVDELDSGTHALQILWGDKLVAIDGETQLAARHEAANMEPATSQDFVPVYICHGKDRMWAKQAFHDLNTLAVKPNAALSIAMDARDAVTKVCREVERHVPYFTGRVNTVRRQLRATDIHVVTITSLRGACVTLAKGINGVQFGARPVPMEDGELPAIEAAAVDWFAAVAEAIGPALEDRDNKVASAPAVLAAIGAMGHSLVQIADSAVRKAEARRLAVALRGVNWARDESWAGIAGKMSPKKVLSVGGAKENAYAVYAALADSTSPGYHTVRPIAQAA